MKNERNEMILYNGGRKQQKKKKKKKWNKERKRSREQVVPVRTNKSVKK